MNLLDLSVRESWVARIGLMLAIGTAAFEAYLSAGIVATGVTLLVGAAIASTLDYVLLNPSRSPHRGFQP